MIPCFYRLMISPQRLTFFTVLFRHLPSCQPVFFLRFQPVRTNLPSFAGFNLLHQTAFLHYIHSAMSDALPSQHSFCCVRCSSFTAFILLCQTLFLHCIHSAASASLQSFAAVRLSLYSPQLMPAISLRSASIIIATSFLKSTSLFQPSSRSAFSQLPQRNSTSAGR